MSKVIVGSIIDHYKILEEIGQGGMGVVFKALNVNLDKLVAVKTIALGLSSDEIFLNRFRTEARALARLQDPNIVNIYDLRLDDNQWFIVMEYVEGITLGRKIRDGGAIPWRESLTIFKQMLSAIGHAHRVGIIHRDIKPNNVMITDDRTVKVTDFGLAKDSQNNNQTMLSSTGGTLFYMSPEQVKGLQFTDFRSDIYALGLTFYEMLTGKIPFRKDDTDFTIREAIIRRQFPIPGHFKPDLPQGLNTIVMHALEKKPEDRYQSVDEMFIAIEEFEQESGLKIRTKPVEEPENDISALPQPSLDISYLREKSTMPKTPEKSDKEHIQKHGWWKYIAAAVVMLISGVMIFSFWETPHPGAVMIATSPSGANVEIDNGLHGLTPLHIKALASGTYSLKISKENHAVLDTFIQMEPDSLQYLSFDLLPFSQIDLDIRPQNAELYIDGIPYKPGSDNKIDLLPGDHMLKLEHPEFYPLEKSFVILRGQDKSLNLVMRKKELIGHDEMVNITIVSEPETARVYYKDQYLGTTPFSGFSVPPGEHLVILRKNGFKEFSLPIIAHSGEAQTITGRLQQSLSSLTVSSTPEGADIWVDDQLQKSLKTPAVLENIAAGDHSIRFEKEGYRPFVSAIMIEPDQENQIFADLVTGQGLVAISVLPWGSIYIDGVLMKEETNTLFQVGLIPGRHNIHVAHPIYGVWDKEISLSDGETLSLPVNFNNRVNVSVTAFDSDGNPIWAEIVVDDKLTGEMTPKEIALRIGHRTIAAKKEGYILVNGEKQVMIDNSLKEPIKFILKKVI